MLCENCRINEVSFRYTEVINGKKNQIALCDSCAKKLGLKNLDKSFATTFGMPYYNKMNNLFELLLEDNSIFNFENTNSMFNNFFEESFDNINKKITQNVFTESNNKYNNENLKSNLSKQEKQEVLKDIENAINKNKTKTKEQIKENKIQKLQQELEKAITQERYEDAAKIRDEIKKYKN